MALMQVLRSACGLYKAPAMGDHEYVGFQGSKEDRHGDVITDMGPGEEFGLSDVRRRSWSRAIVTFSFPVLVMTLMLVANFRPVGAVLQASAPFLDTDRDAATSTSLLEVFQLSPPVQIGSSPAEDVNNSLSQTGQVPLLSKSSQGVNAHCGEVLLMYHVFAYSYGKPYVGSYAPPPRQCVFNRVILNLTIVSAGRQFDRLGHLFFGDTEIWRTSTAEPTPSGIHWTHLKEVSHLVALFKRPQKIIFELGNLVDETYTASFNATLTAKLFHDNVDYHHADLVIPISPWRSQFNASSLFVLPQDKAAVTVSVPQNVRRARFAISACGQADEEFWWSNVPSSVTSTFPDIGELLGHSPFRELQLYIDGSLAGVAWPFPVIFTGGVVPGLWRPVVGIDAFDLMDDEIDLTPWLGVLCDGRRHTFEIRIVGIEDSNSGQGALSAQVGSSWYVTGKLMLWLNEGDTITTGSAPVVNASAPCLSIQSIITAGGSGENGTLQYEIVVRRNFSATASLSISGGEDLEPVYWKQSLEYLHRANLTDGGRTQIVDQTTSGAAVTANYARTFRYPLLVNSTFTVDNTRGNFSIEASMHRGKDVVVSGSEIPLLVVSGVDDHIPRFHAGTLKTVQNGSAIYNAYPSLHRSYSSGATEQDLIFVGIDLPSHLILDKDSLQSSGAQYYHRHVLAVNGTVVEDDRHQSATAQKNTTTGAGVTATKSYMPKTLGQLLGRGRKVTQP